MTPPAFILRDGDIIYHGLWVPLPNAERLLANLKAVAADRKDHFRPYAAELAAELGEVMAQAAAGRGGA